MSKPTVLQIGHGFIEGGSERQMIQMAKLLHEAQEVKIGDKTGAEWTQGYIGPIYTTALNLIILQLDNACLPIYQR